MIRINLLPVKQERRREGARNQIAVGALVVAVELAVCAVLYFSASAEVDEQRNRNTEISDRVTKLKEEVKDHQKILDEITQFEKRQTAIEELQKGRTGPVQVMIELSRILSKDGKPTIDDVRYHQMLENDPASGYDENWDTRRLWLNNFEEAEREVKITGQALTHEDVAEFLRRVNLSDYFLESELVSTALQDARVDVPGFDTKAVGQVVQFVVMAKVRYK